MAYKLEIYDELAALVNAATARFIALARQSILEHGVFRVVLAGGSTPRPVYEALAARHAEIDWSHVHLFWGDERCVPPDHPDSNYHMAHAALIEHVPIPTANVHRMEGERDPVQAAAAYETLLRKEFSDQRIPHFDLILLGMGDDGHTASLFPGTPAVHESQKWVVGHYIEKLNTWRLTLTPAALNAAAHLIFVVSGANKADMLVNVLRYDGQEAVYPSQVVQPTAGSLTWMVDKDAAQKIDTLK